MASNSVIISDPAYASGLAKLRDRSLRPLEVRAIISDLTAIIAKSAISPPPSPDEKLAIIVILRSGLAMMEPFVSHLPTDTNMVIYHLGIFREKQSLQPIEYYNKLAPKSSNIKRAFILDPVVATGGTAGAAINILKDWGIEHITFACILASSSGLASAASIWPESTRFVVGAVDEGLDDKGYIQPGVGDIGDRLFGTALQ